MRPLAELSMSERRHLYDALVTIRHIQDDVHAGLHMDWLV
jgi:hypothetical protein